MSITITNIPRIMRYHGWNNGAALMSRWFSRSAQRVPDYAPPDTTTIKMDWILGYPGPKGVYDKIFEERVWANEAARGVLASRLSKWGKLTGFAANFDQSKKSVTELEDEYINFRPYGGGYSGYSGYYGSSGYSGSGYSGAQGASDNSNNASGVVAGGLNDLIAAIGAFTFRIVVVGSTTPVLPKGRQVTITKVGVFVRDSYDFDGFQFLGFWNDTNNSVSTLNPFSGTGVYNSTFRDYRTKTKMGGDFLVFSDVKWTTLPTPHTFML